MIEKGSWHENGIYQIRSLPYFLLFFDDNCPKMFLKPLIMDQLCAILLCWLIISKVPPRRRPGVSFNHGGLEFRLSGLCYVQVYGEGFSLLIKKTIPPQNDIHVLNKSKKNVTHKWVKSVIKIHDFMEFLQILGPFLKQFSTSITFVSNKYLFRSSHIFVFWFLVFWSL